MQHIKRIVGDFLVGSRGDLSLTKEVTVRRGFGCVSKPMFVENGIRPGRVLLRILETLIAASALEHMIRT